MVPMKRPQPHSSMYPTRLGLPKARRSRSTQSIESDMADVEGEALPNTTASGPDSAAIAVSRDAMVASASSQLSRSQPGSAAPFGVVWRSGYSSRSGCATISGAALFLTQIACPVGWPGSGRSASRRPSSTVAVAPHRDTHSGQNVATSVANPHPPSHPADSVGPQHIVAPTRAGGVIGSADLGLDGPGEWAAVWRMETIWAPWLTRAPTNRTVWPAREAAGAERVRAWSLACPVEAQNGQLSGSGASCRLVAPAGMNCTATVFATAPLSSRMMWTWPPPGSTKALLGVPAVYTCGVQAGSSLS